MAPHAPLVTSDFADEVQRSLLRLLEGVRGKKNLVIQKQLAGPVSICVKFSTLQDYGVDRVFFLENDNVDTSQRNVIFLAHGESAKEILQVAEQIKRLRSESPQDHEFSVFWVPRRTLIADQLLEDAGVLGEVNVSELPLYLLPLGDDLLSLELPGAFGDLYLRRDPSCIFTSASALMRIQQQQGLFPRITGKGDNAKRLANLLVRMRNELNTGDGASRRSSSQTLNPSTGIESLIIVDREVDFPSVLMTQLTYEGLIDETFHIDSGQVELDTSITGTSGQQAGGQQQQQGLKRKMQLDGNDSLYSQLRDANFAVVGPLLNKVARRLQSTYESRNTAQKTTAELREFVQKLGGYQAEQASLKLHTNLAEEIIKITRSERFSKVLEVQQNVTAGADATSQHDNISELIAQNAPLRTVLRLLCLESVVNGGLRQKDLESFKREIIHAYGHQHLVTLSSLEKMGLLQVRGGTAASLVGSQSSKAGSATDYGRVRRTLQLIFDDVNESDPDDIAYAYSGYAPLSVRLVQCVLQKKDLATLVAGSRSGGGGQQIAAMAASAGTQGWRPFEDTLKSVRGATFDITQSGEEKAVRARQILNGAKDTGALKTVVIFFLGGICRAEIAAVRWVGRRLLEEGKNFRLLIATTSILTGDDVVGAAVEQKSFDSS